MNRMNQATRRTLSAVCTVVLGMGALQACSAPASVNNDGVQQASTQNKSTLRGEMILPYETQSNMQTQSLVEGDAFLRLSAQVDGEPVTLNIESSRVSAGQTYVQYRMSALPPIQENQVYTVEVFTPENKPFLGAVLDIEEHPDFRLNLDVDSTAVLIAARREARDPYLVDLSPAEVRIIRRDPSLVSVRTSVRSLLRDVGSLTTGILDSVFNGVAKILDRR